MGELCKWPDAQASYFVDSSRVPGPLGSKDFHDAIAWAMQQWESVSPFRFYIAPSAGSARLSLSFDGIDPSGTELGLTQEPCNQPATAQLWSKYNTAATWSLPRLYLAVLHELGHFLGLAHSPSGTKSIMSAYLDETLSGLQPWDIEQVQARYGAPLQPAGSTLPGPTPPPPTTTQTYDPVEVPLPDGGTLRLDITFIPPAAQ